MESGERRLGAIMFTDLVGYSAITSRDERRALKLLEEHRAALQSVFERHGGVIVKTMGDGLLVEFASAVEAVCSAVEAQLELRRFNVGREERASVRIGLHVGDIVHSGGDILGDAVNVAARLQPLAAPGGICASRQVVDQIERKVPYRIVNMGVRELKNMKYPVEVYSVEVPSGDAPPEEQAMDPRRVAILPLANLSSDPNDRYFADGMTEELISTVSKIAELNVISRTSVMRYKDTTLPIGEIGKELSAGTVLEGSVRKAGNKVRITTQLIDTQHDKHLWAQSYDRDMTDIFAIQADIAEKVAEALRVRLAPREKEAVEKTGTRDPEAHTLYLKGRQFWNERTALGVEKAIRYFTDATQKDPGFALGYSGLADCHLIQLDRGWVSFDRGVPLALMQAEKAVELDPELAEAHASLGSVSETKWDFARAEKELKRAIELRPSYATAHHWCGLLLARLGRHQESYEQEARAHELDPYSSIVTQMLACDLFFIGRVRDAMAQFERLVESDPEFGSGHYWKAWAHVSLGEFDDAAAEMRRCMKIMGESLYTAGMGLASVLLRAGHRDEALKVLDEAMAEPAKEYRSPAKEALVRFDLGSPEEAFSLLEKAVSEHDGFLLYLKGFPFFASYRLDPRWSAIESRIGPSGT